MIVYHYLQLARAFGWTPDQCDEIELELFFDLLIVAHLDPKDSEEEHGFIDFVL